MAQRTTDDLQMELMTRADLRGFLQDNQAELIEPNMAQALQALFATRQMTKAALADGAHMSEVYLHQVFSGRRRLSRDRTLCILFALHASVEEAQTLLKQSGLAQLYARDRRDAVLLHGLAQRMDLYAVDALLLQERLEPLDETVKKRVQQCIRFFAVSHASRLPGCLCAGIGQHQL